MCPSTTPTTANRMSSTQDPVASDEPAEGTPPAAESLADESGATDSPARAKADSAAERVAHIRGLMTSGQYVTGKTPHELAAVWGLAVSTVYNYSTEASRQVRAGLGDADQVRTMVFGWLEEAASIARVGRDARGLVSAAKELAVVAGVAAPQRVQVEGLGDLLSLAFQTTSDREQLSRR